MLRRLIHIISMTLTGYMIVDMHNLVIVSIFSALVSFICCRLVIMNPEDVTFFVSLLMLSFGIISNDIFIKALDISQTSQFILFVAWFCCVLHYLKEPYVVKVEEE